MSDSTPGAAGGGGASGATATLKIERPTVSILISGPSRTGKTSAANILAERYDVENIKTGEKIRELTGIDNSRFVARELTVDQQMDAYQADKIRSATADEPFILEARLAAFLASKERADRWLPVVTILFWAPEGERMQRQLRKLRRDHPQTTTTLEELREGEREREARDMELWKAVHPELDGRNVFDPGLTNAAGRPVYDLVVDTRMGKPDDCADHVHAWLARSGAIRTTGTVTD
ncbi:MAG: AAA family ATPase [Candidatus Limnocylindrales bacterium]